MIGVKVSRSSTPRLVIMAPLPPSQNCATRSDLSSRSCWGRLGITGTIYQPNTDLEGDENGQLHQSLHPMRCSNLSGYYLRLLRREEGLGEYA
jgi:hypothetical protein